MSPEITEGAVLYWIVFDPHTGEPVLRCSSRAQARKSAGKDGRIAKVVVAH